jgi:hypothetical protein
LSSAVIHETCPSPDHWQVARHESVSANPIGDRRLEGEPELVADDDVLAHEA